jgi:hypothetical protein
MGHHVISTPSIPPLYRLNAPQLVGVGGSSNPAQLVHETVIQHRRLRELGLTGICFLGSNGTTLLVFTTKTWKAFNNGPRRSGRLRQANFNMACGK